MKKIISIILIVTGFSLIFFNRNYIVRELIKNIVHDEEISFEFKNSYYLKYNFKSIKSLDEFEINNKDDLINLYYTIINNGNDTFEFYCPKDYKNCVEDVKDIANNPKGLSIINGYVHPYNSFDTIETVYNSLGEVTITVRKTYNESKIKLLNDKIQQVVDSEIKDEQDIRTIIKIVHDYIINNTIYDKERTDKNIINYESNNAYGVLYQGYGICSGYADAMALFLNYYEIPNFKLASENHVWNVVLLDDKWYHLDLTWDDPILTSGENVLDDTYFLITTEQLKELNEPQHHYDETVYKELLEN